MPQHSVHPRQRFRYVMLMKKIIEEQVYSVERPAWPPPKLPVAHLMGKPTETLEGSGRVGANVQTFTKLQVSNSRSSWQTDP